MKKTIKCLSVWQPWAWLLVHGIKDVENRYWYTNHRGIVLIHASKRIDTQSLHYYRVEYDMHDLPVGAIVGQVELTACTRIVQSEWHDPEQWGWYVAKPVVYTNPIPYRGRQKLFDVPVSVVPELMAA